MENVAGAFSEDVDLDLFLTQKLPQILSEHVDLKRFFEKDVIVSLLVKESGKRYSILFGATSDYQYERREMIDFPLVTLVVPENAWTHFRVFLAQWVPQLLRKQTEFYDEFFFSSLRQKAFEKLDGIVSYQFQLRNGTTLSGSLILNDYDPPKGGKHLSISFSEEALWEMLQKKPSEALQTDRFRIEGDLSLAAAVARALSKK